MEHFIELILNYLKSELNVIKEAPLTILSISAIFGLIQWYFVNRHYKADIESYNSRIVSKDDLIKDRDKKISDLKGEIKDLEKDKRRELSKKITDKTDKKESSKDLKAVNAPNTFPPTSKQDILDRCMKINEKLKKFVYKRTIDKMGEVKVKALYYERYSCEVVALHGLLKENGISDRKLDAIFENPDNLGHMKTIYERFYFIAQKLSQPENNQTQITQQISVPYVSFEITQFLPDGNKTSLPDVRFNLKNPESIFLQILVVARIYLGDDYLGTPLNDNGTGRKDYYSGNKLWNMNPGDGINGHFSVPQEAMVNDKQLKIIVDVETRNQNGKKSILLPKGWTYNRENNYWIAEP